MATRRSRTWRRTHRGFTFTELVMVIAIVGILATVALPRLTATGDFQVQGTFDRAFAAVRYLRSMLRNRFIDVRIRRHHVARREPLGALDSVWDNEYPGPEQLAADAQASAELHAALAQLPPAQREVLALWSQSMSIRDMCELTGAPLDTVLNRRKYGLARLRKTLVHRTPQHTQRPF